MDLPGRQARAALGRRRSRVPPELVARRQVAGLRELGAGGGPHLEAARRRPRASRSGSRGLARSIATRSGRPTASGSWPSAPRARARRESRRFGSDAGLDLVWIPAEGGDATLISPARGASRPHFASDPDRIYVTTPQGLVSMRFDGTDRRTHLSVIGKNALLPGRAGAGRGDPASPRRAMGAGARHHPALPAGPAPVRRRGAQGRRPRALRPAQEAHRHRRRLRRLGRRRQDDHLGHRLELLPPAVRFGRLRAPEERRRREADKDEDKDKPRPRRRNRSPSPRRWPSSSSGRGTGRAARSC